MKYDLVFGYFGWIGIDLGIWVTFGFVLMFWGFFFFFCYDLWRFDFVII